MVVQICQNFGFESVFCNYHNTVVIWFKYKTGFPFKTNKPKNLDPFYKTDLDFCDHFGRENPVL